MGVLRVRDGLIWGASRSLLYDTLERIAGHASDAALKDILAHAVLRGDSFFDFSGLSGDQKAGFLVALDRVVSHQEADPALAAEPSRARVLELRRELLAMVEEDLARDA